MLSGVQPDHACDLCDNTGTMTWQQPVPGPGGLTLTEMSHPCVNGCSGWYRLPAAESGSTIGPTVAGGPVAGNVAAANQDHRTEWSRPAPSTSDPSAPR